MQNPDSTKLPEQLRKLHTALVMLCALVLSTLVINRRPDAQIARSSYKELDYLRAHVNSSWISHYLYGNLKPVSRIPEVTEVFVSEMYYFNQDYYLMITIPEEFRAEWGETYDLNIKARPWVIYPEPEAANYYEVGDTLADFITFWDGLSGDHGIFRPTRLPGSVSVTLFKGNSSSPIEDREAPKIRESPEEIKLFIRRDMISTEHGAGAPIIPMKFGALTYDPPQDSKLPSAVLPGFLCFFQGSTIASDEIDISFFMFTQCGEYSSNLLEALTQAVAPRMPALSGTKKKNFSETFPFLHALTKDYANLPFNDVGNILDKEAGRARENIKILNLEFPLSLLGTWGLGAVVGIQFFFYLHFIHLKRRLPLEDAELAVPWIGLYREKGARVVFLLSAQALPFCTAATKYFISLTSAAGSRELLIQTALVVASLWLSLKGVRLTLDLWISIDK